MTVTRLRWVVVAVFGLATIVLLLVELPSAREYFKDLGYCRGPSRMYAPPKTVGDLHRMRPPLHSSMNYEVQECGPSLETMQDGFDWISDGYKMSKNVYIHNEIVATSSDFDVQPVNTEDFPETQTSASQIWYVTPKRWGLIRLGFKTATYRLDPRTQKKAELPQGNTTYYEVFIDPPLFTVEWWKVHFGAFAWVVPILLGLVTPLFIKKREERGEPQHRPPTEPDSR